MVTEEETPDRVGPETGLERLLGLSERHDASVLSVRFTRGPLRRSRPQAPHHRGRGHHAAHTRAPQKGLHLLPKHGLR